MILKKAKLPSADIKKNDCKVWEMKWFEKTFIHIIGGLIFYKNLLNHETENQNGNNENDIVDNFCGARDSSKR